MTEWFGEVSLAAAGDGVGVVEIHRPPANYFDAPLLDGVVAAVDRAGVQGCRAVVLCSEGRHFCAGLDFGASRTPTPEGLSRCTNGPCN